MKKMLAALLPLCILFSCVAPDPKDEETMASPQSPAPTPLPAPTTRGETGINQNEVISPDGSNVQGHYAGDIWPVNYNLHFKKIGTVLLTRENDIFTSTIEMEYGPKETRVKQALYTARRCPNLNDDLNKDAYIDIQEARVAMGKITIPFDMDLSGQDAGMDMYPTVDVTGKMFYSQSTSFSLLFEDLKALDLNPMDDVIKIEDGITFPGRVVLFQGMPTIIPLPETVATVEGEEKHQSIPVGCAVIWKIKKPGQ